MESPFPHQVGALSDRDPDEVAETRNRCDGFWMLMIRVTKRTSSFLGAGSAEFASRGPWLPRSPSPAGTPRTSTRVPHSRSASRGRSFPGGPTTVRVCSRAFLGDGVNSPSRLGCPPLTPHSLSRPPEQTSPSTCLPAATPPNLSARRVGCSSTGRRSTRARSIRTPRYPRRTSKPRS